MGIVTDVILPLALAFIMFSLGLGLTLDDFARVARRPRDFIVGAVSQIILLPVVAFVLVSVWSLPAEAVGSPRSKTTTLSSAVQPVATSVTVTV